MLPNETMRLIAELNATKHPRGTLKTQPVGERAALETLAGKNCWHPQLGWHHWTGQIWKPTDPEAIHRTLHRWIVTQLHRAIETNADNDIIKTLTNYREPRALKQLLEAAKTVPQIRVTNFDPNPRELNCPNGTVNLTTGQIRPHDPTDFNTKITRDPYHEGYTHPDWDAALTAIHPNDAEWLQTRIGQTLTGHPSPDDIAILLQGGGSNGKTILIDTLNNTLGNYSSVIMDSNLLGKNSHPTELMALRGLRLAIVEELPEGRYLQSVALKKMVGSGTLVARHIRGNPIEFRASHNLIMTSNYLPKIGENDHGTWRRLRLIPFPHRYTNNPQRPHDRQGDPHLKHRLTHNEDGRAAALAWAIEGATKYHLNGFIPDTKTIIQATQQWREGADLIGTFIKDNLEIEEGYALPTRDVFHKFTEYLEQGKHRQMSETTFVTKLLTHPLLDEHIETKRIRPTTRDYTLPNTVPNKMFTAYIALRWATPQDYL